MAETIIKFYLSCPAGDSLQSPVGVAESSKGDSLYACPAGGYFSMKKSNQKSLGEDPETP